MKALGTEILARCKNPWFLISVFLTVGSLWTGLGTGSYDLLHGTGVDGGALMEEACTASLNLLCLPLLAALPASSAARKELASGAFRNVLFRCGTRRYLMSRVLSLLIVAGLAQFIGLLGFALLVSLSGQFIFPLSLVASRMLCAMGLALVGSAGALLVRDTVCAYVMPVVLCFSMSMLQARFWLEAKYLDLLVWLSGDPVEIGVLAGLVLVLSLGYGAYLYREVRRNV